MTDSRGTSDHPVPMAPQSLLNASHVLACRGLDLVEYLTRSALAPAHGALTRGTSSAPQAMLFIRKNDRHIPVVGSEITLGRRDPLTGDCPDVDLSLEADEYANMFEDEKLSLEQIWDVDRGGLVIGRHARIMLNNGEFYVVAEGHAAGYTRLNFVLLPAGVKTRLSFGDYLAIGPVDLEFGPPAVPTKIPRAILVVESSRRAIPMESDLLFVGRRNSSDIKVDLQAEDASHSVGDPHAVINNRGGVLWVDELGGGRPHGTYVNGVRLGRSGSKIEFGDHLRFGQVVVRVTSPSVPT